MYTLAKISRPGFELKTEHIEIVRKILENEICSMCTLQKEGSVEHEGLTVNKNYYNELIDNTNSLYEQHDGYKTITKNNLEKLKIVDKAMVYELLTTSCGAEYWFEHKEEENSDDYMKQYEEDIEEYTNLIKEGINA